MKIRDAQEIDLERILDIWKQSAEIAVGRPIEKINADYLKRFFHERIFMSKPFGFWVAENEGEVVGWQALLPFDNNPVMRGYNAESSTYVSNDFLYRGVGETLIRYAMCQAQETDLQYIFGFISFENPAALSMVKKCGWEAVGLVPTPKKMPIGSKLHIVVYVVDRKL